MFEKEVSNFYFAIDANRSIIDALYFQIQLDEIKNLEKK